MPARISPAVQPPHGERAGRAEPSRGVGAAAEIPEVVHEIRSDLDEDAPPESGQRGAEPEAVIVRGKRHAHEDRHDRGRQGGDPGRVEPRAGAAGRPGFGHRAQGRRRNLEKSGFLRSM